MTLESRQKRKAPLVEDLIGLRKSISTAMELILDFENAVADDYLNGTLDAAGHRVEVCEVMRGGRFVRALVIDGKVWR